MPAPFPLSPAELERRLREQQEMEQRVREMDLVEPRVVSREAAIPIHVEGGTRDYHSLPKEAGPTLATRRLMEIADDGTLAQILMKPESAGLSLTGVEPEFLRKSRAAAWDVAKAGRDKIDIDLGEILSGKQTGHGGRPASELGMDALSVAGEFYDKKFETPIRDATVGQFGEWFKNLGGTAGLGLTSTTPAEAKAWRNRLRDKPTIGEQVAYDPFMWAGLGAGALTAKSRHLLKARHAGKLLPQKSFFEASQAPEFIFRDLHTAPKEPLLRRGVQALKTNPFSEGRRDMLKGGLGVALGAGLMKGGASQLGEIPKLRPSEAMDLMQYRWANQKTGPLTQAEWVAEDLGLAGEALTGRGKGLTLDQQLQVEHQLSERGLHSDYGDVLDAPTPSVKLGQGQAPLTAEKLEQVVRGSSEAELRRMVAEELENTQIRAAEGWLGKIERDLRGLLARRDETPLSIAEQQARESLGDTHYFNLPIREKIRRNFGARREYKKELSGLKQQLSDVLSGAPLKHQFDYPIHQQSFRDHKNTLRDAVGAMGSELVDPNSPVFSQPVLDNLNDIMLKHNEEAFDLIQKYKRGGDPFEMAMDLRAMQNKYGTPLVDSLADEAVDLLEKATPPDSHSLGREELRFNLEHLLKPYNESGATRSTQHIPQDIYPVVQPPANAPASSFDAVQPPLIKWLKKRNR